MILRFYYHITKIKNNLGFSVSHSWYKKSVKGPISVLEFRPKVFGFQPGFQFL